MPRGPLLVLALVVLAIGVAWWALRTPELPAARGTASPGAGTPAAVQLAPLASAPAAKAADVGPDERRVVVAVVELLGRVVDAEGNGLSAVPVYVLLDPPLTPAAMAQCLLRGVFLEPIAATATAGDGAFRVVVPPTAVAERLQVVALGTQHGDASLRGVRTAGSSTRLPELRLPRERPVQGFVVDGQNGVPIAGAVVSARADGVMLLRVPGREDGRLAVSDAAGAFMLGGLAAGSYTFRASAAGYAAEEHVQQAVFADQPTERMFALQPGHRLRGQVFDRESRPVQGAWVAAVALGALPFARATATTDAAGAFALAGLGEGRWRLTVGKVGQCTLVQELAVVPETAPLVLTLRPRGAIRLEVVDPDGVPCARFEVAARPAMPAGGLRALPKQRVLPEQLHDGVFVLEDVEPGDWTLQVGAPGAAPTHSAVVEVSEGATTTAKVQLLRGATVHLQLLAGDGKPLASARVQVQPDGFADGPVADVLSPLQGVAFAGAEGRSGVDGRVVLEHVPPGPCQLRIDGDGRVPWYVRGVVVAPDRVELGRVTVPDGVRLRGVAGVDGAVDASVVVQVLALPGGNLPAGYRVEAAVDAKGQWACPVSLPAGRYEVLAGRRRVDDPFLENQDHGVSRVEVELVAGERERRVDLALPRRPQ